MEGGQGQQALYGGAVLAAECPAQVGADDPDGPGSEPQGMGDFEAVAERRLGGDDQDDLSVRLLPGDAVFRFEEGMLLTGTSKVSSTTTSHSAKASFPFAGLDDRAEEDVPALHGPGAHRASRLLRGRRLPAAALSPPG